MKNDMLNSINPYTLKTIRSCREHTEEEVEEIIETSHRSFIQHKNNPYPERARILSHVAKILHQEKTYYAGLMAREMGKPVQQGISEAEKCAWVCEYYAENAEGFLSNRIIDSDARQSYVSFEPLGVLLAIMPWNFPFWQVFRATAPAFMSGNSVLLKHSSNVTGCAMAIEELLEKSGLPSGLFRTLLIDSKRVSSVIEHPFIKCVTLTGSTEAGSSVAMTSGKYLKKTVLELGGSDPYIILEDADLAKTVETCVTSRLINNGQSCIAAKRFIVLEDVLDDFTEQFLEMMASRKMGDPLDINIDIGPLARIDLRDGLHRQVRDSISQGAKLLLGGNIPNTNGAFYPPTVLSNVTRDMPVFKDETFGPVAAIMGVKDEAEAIKTANDSVYGLGAAVFTQDIRRGEHIARDELEAGCCFVNEFVKSDPRLPFGGIKNSGYGRELSSFGIQEFVNLKTIYIQ